MGIKKRILLLFIISVPLFFYQNCSEGFKTAEIEIGSDSNGDTNTTPDGPTPAPDAPPTLGVPAGVNVLGVNVGAKILVNLLTPPEAGLTYVVRTNPQSGQLMLADAPGVANGGVIYTPNPNFIGSDSFTLAVRTSDGVMGPDQTFDVRVDQKGIGQMIGTFQQAACVPNVSPFIQSYVSTASSFSQSTRAFSADCTFAFYDLVIQGNHAVGNENIVTGSGVTGFEYNITNKTMVLTPLSVAAAQAMNTANFCGFNNWVGNVAKNISLTGCNGVWAGPNTFQYRRVEFPVGEAPRMYIATQVGGNGTSPVTRSPNLALDSPLIKTAN